MGQTSSGSKTERQTKATMGSHHELLIRAYALGEKAGIGTFASAGHISDDGMLATVDKSVLAALVDMADDQTVAVRASDLRAVLTWLDLTGTSDECKQAAARLNNAVNPTKTEEPQWERSLT